MKRESPGVIVATDAFSSLDDGIIAHLKEGLPSSPRGRMRFCAHRTPEDPLHEMVIVLSRGTYIRPHRHFAKSESVHVIEGHGDLVLFDASGNVRDVLPVGPFGSGRCFFYRMELPEYHMLVVGSDTLVIHETTNGPFRSTDTEFASWAPVEGDIEARTAFLSRVEAAIRGSRTSLQDQS